MRGRARSTAPGPLFSPHVRESMPVKRNQPGERRAGLRCRKGQGLVEYALILAVVVLVVIMALTHLGQPVDNILTGASNTFPPTL